MSRESQFEGWAARARQEAAPRLNIAASVLQRIYTSPRRRETDVPWLVLSGLSALAASVMLAVTVDCWQSLTDPMAGLFTSLTLVMQ